MKLRLLGAAVFSLGLALILLMRPGSPARAQSGESSCRTCHEVQGENPVGDTGEWHRQHNVADMCSVCHAGNAQAADQGTAHVGVIKNPLDKAASTCSTCHPEDYAARVEQYAVLMSPAATATLAPTPSLEATAITSQTPLPTATAPLLTPTAQPPTAGEPPAPTQTPIDWFAVLRFARGPLFRAARWFFVIGMLYRLARIIRLGWQHECASDRRRAASGVAKSFLQGLIVWPYIPWVKGTFWRNAVTYVAGGLFHLGLLTVIFLSRTHMLVWKGLIGFGWPTLPPPLVAWLAAGAIVSMIALLINRFVNPVLRLLSGPAEWLNWLIVFLPMISGLIMARRWWLPYEVMFSVHMLAVDVLLVWIPLSRISHFLFYFFARTVHGLEFGRRLAAP